MCSSNVLGYYDTLRSVGVATSLNQCLTAQVSTATPEALHCKSSHNKNVIYKLLRIDNLQDTVYYLS